MSLDMWIVDGLHNETDDGYVTVALGNTWKHLESLCKYATHCTICAQQVERGTWPTIVDMVLCLIKCNGWL